MPARDQGLPDLGLLFPGRVAGAVGVPGRIPGRLFDVESAAVSGAVPRRQLEFAAGRLCGRAALRRLGFDDTPIPRRPDRRPVWPAGVVGSISHSRGICGAVVGHASEFAGIGLDIEIADACEPRLARRVLTGVERERVATLEGAVDSGRWTTMIFSAKESVYKALAGIVELPEFEDVEVTPQPAEQAFFADLRDGRRLHGTFCHAADWVLTGVAVPAAGFERKQLDSERSKP